MRTIPESDWKVLSSLRPIAYERFCERALSKASAVLADATLSNGDRFGTTLQLMQESNRDLDCVFQNISRSNAFVQVLILRSRSLWTDEEFSRFSPSTRNEIDATKRTEASGR